MACSEVTEVGHIQHIVATSTVGIDNAGGHDFTLDDGKKSGPGRVWNDLRIHPYYPFHIPNTGILPAARRLPLPLLQPPS